MTKELTAAKTSWKILSLTDIYDTFSFFLPNGCARNAPYITKLDSGIHPIKKIILSSTISPNTDDLQFKPR